jgi:tRNA A-37 threonylcarbamoyl transferase component Bud32
MEVSMTEQIPMPRAAREYLEREMIGKRVHGLTIKRVLGPGSTAMTYEAEDKYGVAWALKLVARKSYGKRKPFTEIAKFAHCQDRRFLVFPEETGKWTLRLRRQALNFVWFKSRCIRGKTVRDFLASGAPFDAKNEVQRYVQNIATALEELRRLGFAHGDLHDGNIMRQLVGQDGPLPETRYVVIDFSEAHPVSAAQEGLRKDLECFGGHLRRFSDAIYRRGELSRDDEKVLKAIAHIPGLLNGISAETVGAARPSAVLRRFEEGLASAEEVPRKLRSPFDSLSAEDITNDALLAELCFTESRWAAQMEIPGNVLLVGPRGCGKSMMFRRFRLKTKVAAEKTSEMRDDKYVGFYLPCESLFFNRFSDLTEGIVDRNRDALVLFFNMAVTAEVMSTLAVLPDFLGPVTSRAAEAVRELVQEEVDILWDALRFPQAITNISDVGYYAERVMCHVRREIAYGNSVAARGSTDFPSRLVEVVKAHLPSLSPRLFIFFLDDYTEERVPVALQKVLHPIVCQRSGNLCFKISAHMFGSMYSFPQNLALDEGRNIAVINLGSQYLNRDRKRAEGQALVQIMNQRFAQCEGYQGTIEQWLGDTCFPDDKSLNRALHDPETRKDVKYHGIQCLQELCTGDISEMIRVVGDIFQEAAVRPNSIPRRIAPEEQDKAIRSVSRDFVGRVRHIRPDGQKLFEVLTAFGDLSQQLLYDRELVGQGTDAHGNPRQDPCDLLTIYVDSLTKASAKARRIWERLQRASIFVDIRLAPSQRAVIADRATLRRVYCPAFSTTLTSSEHLQLTKVQFERFTESPGEFCTEYSRKVTGKPKGPTLWTERPPCEEEGPEVPPPTTMPNSADRYDFTKDASPGFSRLALTLPELKPAQSVMAPRSDIDLYIGAMGFEERTTGGVAALVDLQVRARKAFLLEFDMYYAATEKRRKQYEALMSGLTGGTPYQPLNAPIGNPDPVFPQRLKGALEAVAAAGRPRIVFDCTSCPALVLSKCLRVLLDHPCDLTIIYSEADQYYPTHEEWESGKLPRKGARVEGPFSGVRFVEKPSVLQSDDIGERPILLVLFPTFNTERTWGVLTELEPGKRIWLFGEPHDLERNSYRIEMAQFFAVPVMVPGDPWSLVTTFDYRATMTTLAAIYASHRFSYRLVIMPHGSKMQTLGAGLFAAAHQASMVFAVPQNYDPDRYSRGCVEVWAVPLGDTQRLIEKLKLGRAVAS